MLTLINSKKYLHQQISSKANDKINSIEKNEPKNPSEDKRNIRKDFKFRQIQLQIFYCISLNNWELFQLIYKIIAMINTRNDILQILKTQKQYKNNLSVKNIYVKLIQSELQYIFNKSSKASEIIKMLLKISFKTETHVMKLRQHTTFNDLQHHVSKVFKKLPSKYTFVYIDDEGDQITLDNQNDMLNMLSSEMTKVNIKIISDDVQQKQDGSIIKEFQSPRLEIESVIGDDESKDQIFSQASSKVKFDKSQSNSSQIVNIKNQNPKQVIQIKQPKQIKQFKQSKQVVNQQIKIQKQPIIILQAKHLQYIQLKMQKKIQESPKNIHHEIKCDLCDMCPIVGIRYKCNVCYDFDLCENCEKVYDHQHSMLKIKYNNQQYQRKDGASAVEILGTNIIFGANKLKQGLKTAVTTITRKMSGKSENSQKKIQQKIQIKHQLKDNALAALDKLKDRQQIQQQQKPKPRKPIFKTQQDKRIQAANYISLIIGVDFSRSYAFVKKHQGLQKQQLIVKYFQNEKAM